MLIRCPYPDCFFVYELAAPHIEKLSLTHSLCPNCQKKGTAISLEIHNMLQKREKQARENQNDASTIPRHNKFTVLLDNMRSLWNVGSIFRTADAAGVSMLYLCGITGCPPNSAITKTALGAEESIPWQYFIHPLDIISQLKTKGVCVIGLERSHNSIPLTTLLKEKKISKPVCLVVGNEVQGLSPETLHSCQYICSLPMQGKKESLNAAVAFGIAAYFINEWV